VSVPFRRARATRAFDLKTKASRFSGSGSDSDRGSKTASVEAASVALRARTSVRAQRLGTSVPCPLAERLPRGSPRGCRLRPAVSRAYSRRARFSTHRETSVSGRSFGNVPVLRNPGIQPAPPIFGSGRTSFETWPWTHSNPPLRRVPARPLGRDWIALGRRFETGPTGPETVVLSASAGESRML
jgi:hypothetical protein